MTTFSVVSAPTVTLQVTSSVNANTVERRFNKDLSIIDLKHKLELLVGSCPTDVHLELFDTKNGYVGDLTNDEAVLGSYPVDDNYRLHVVDKSGKKGIFEDLSKVEKFELTEDEYEKKSDSVRAWMKKNQYGKFNPESAKAEEEKEENEANLAAKFKVGDRCEVSLQSAPVRRATIMYVGDVKFKPGKWVGLKYDLPYGKNDGSVQGERYFECKNKYGGFVRPSAITVGDFEEEGLDELDEI